MQTKKGTIFGCPECSCELLCMTGCPKDCCKNPAPVCCCGEKMKKIIEPQAVK